MNLPTIAWDSILSSVLGFLPRLGAAALVYILARLISSWATNGVRKAMERQKRDPELILLIEMLTRWGVLALGIVLALEQLAPGRLSGLVAGLGIAGFTIGFALQDVAKNFVAGILLLILQPFDIGDAIQVNGHAGSVLNITLRSTDLRTWDGLHVIIPNTDVFVNPIINYSKAGQRRLEIDVGVAYDLDLDRVTRVTLEALKELPGVLSDPAPQVVFSNFGGSAIEFKLYYWIDTTVTDYLAAQNGGYKVLKETYERESIEMPFPTQTVRVAQGGGS
jgi:small conductance mechanosensitive channel